MKVIRRTKKEVVDLTFEVGQTYITKMQTADKFTISKVEFDKKTKKIILVHGTYNDNYDLLCRLTPDRLIPRQEATGKILDECLCPHCNKEINL
jgi:hypothetical protein